MGERFEFTADLWRTSGEVAWHFVTVPMDESDMIAELTEPTRRGFGSVRVEVTVGATTWRTSVFPDSKSGAFVLPVKQSVRREEQLDVGEPVAVRIGLIGCDRPPTLSAVIEIRPAVAGDLTAIYDICARTGDAGADAREWYDDPELLGHVYAGPYVVHEPSLAFVAEDEQGVAGYVLGARDVAEFGARLERSWWPPLRSHYPLDGDYRDTDRRLVAKIHTPPSGSSFAAAYPSELHIDLLPRCQGTGAGRTLIATLLDALRQAGSPGVHLGVDPRNTNASGFYRHLGFTERDDGGGVTFTLDLE